MLSQVARRRFWYNENGIQPKNKISPPRFPITRTLLFISIVTLFSACATSGAPVPPPTYASYFDQLPCVDRIGRCFDARIAGQPVAVIAEKSRHDTITAIARQASSHIGSVYWEVPVPVDGKKVLDVVVGANEFGQKDVGEPIEEPELIVYALDSQPLKSKTEQVASRDVRVNRQPVMTQQNTLNQAYLPAGRYVMTIRYRGQRNWERKNVFLTVH